MQRVLRLAVVVNLLPRHFAALRKTGDGTPPDLRRMIATQKGGICIEEVIPPGLPVLLADGSVAWSRLWRSMQTALAEQGFCAFAFDMPLMDNSDRDTQADYARQILARRLLSLGQVLQIKLIRVPQSFGAGAMTDTAMPDPQSFAGPVVVSGAIGLNAEPAPMPLNSPCLCELLISATVANPLMSGLIPKAFFTARSARHHRSGLVRAGNAGSLPVGQAGQSDPHPRSADSRPADVLPQVGDIPQLAVPEACNPSLAANLATLRH